MAIISVVNVLILVKVLVIQHATQHARVARSPRLAQDAQIVVVEIVRKVVVALVVTIVRHRVKTHHQVVEMKIMIVLYHLPLVL